MDWKGVFCFLSSRFHKESPLQWSSILVFDFASLLQASFVQYLVNFSPLCSCLSFEFLLCYNDKRISKHHSVIP